MVAAEVGVKVSIIAIIVVANVGFSSMMLSVSSILPEALLTRLHQLYEGVFLRNFMTRSYEMFCVQGKNVIKCTLFSITL